MGEIINTRNTSNKKVIMKIEVNLEEIENLKGHLKNIQIFNSNLCNKESEINSRGNNGVTKYFKVPLTIRTRKKYTGELKYQKLDTPTKCFYIYTIEKDKE